MGIDKEHLGSALRAGVVGAATVTVLNQVGKQVIPDAPQMDVLGERAIARGLEAVGHEAPAGRKLFSLSLVGDVVSNSAFYALVGVGGARGAWRRGAMLGAAAGLGALFLPQRLGLGSGPSSRTPATRMLAFAWYTTAGLVAAAVTSRRDA